MLDSNNKTNIEDSTPHEQNDGDMKQRCLQFTSLEIINMTRNFTIPIGKGGFGIVYLGYLHDETQVAVKVLSLSSFQGVKEFQAEVHQKFVYLNIL